MSSPSSQSVPITSYDELPYPSQPLAQSDPDRLAALARMFGLQSPPVDRCRVLELGCAAGGNLIPLADRFSDSQFIGVDNSQRQVAAGRQAIERLGLKNVELSLASIADLDEQLGQFDYILCHGVFSWVSHELQEKILEICRTRLSPRGMVYLSYNIYPGWHVRGILREVACNSSQKSQSPLERTTKAARALHVLSESLAGDPSPSAKVLKDEIDTLLKMPTTYLFHEYLEDENHPVYFHEFAERTTRHALQYLGDATPSAMFATNFGADVAHNLAQISQDLISIEQHMDLLRNRGFRQSVLCHRDVPLERFITPRRLAGLYLSGKVKPDNEFQDLRSSANEKYVFEPASRVARSSGVISTTWPWFKAALSYLGSVWPRGIQFEDLLKQVSVSLADGGEPRQLDAKDAENLGNNLIQGFASGLIEAFSQPDAFVTTVSERPLVSPLARLEATATHRVTNRRHETVALDQVSQRLVPSLDGQHDRAALLERLVAAAESNELSILVNDVPIQDRGRLTAILQQALDEQLGKLAVQALLIG